MQEHLLKPPDEYLQVVDGIEVPLFKAAIEDARQSEYGMLASACCRQLCTGHQLLASAACMALCPAPCPAPSPTNTVAQHPHKPCPVCLACLVCLPGLPAWPACLASPIKERHNADH